MTISKRKELKYIQYVDDIKSGVILAPKTIKQAVQRYERDLEESLTNPDYPFYFDEDAGIKVVEFLENLQFNGDNGISQFQVLPWMAFYVSQLYGWKKRSNNFRRFRKALLLIPRQNGKTLLAGGLGLYDLFSVPNSASFIIANSVKQANTGFNYCKSFVETDEDLQVYIEKFQRHLRNKTGGELKTQSSNADSLDSFRSSLTVLDEYHEMKDKSLIKVITSGQVSRDEPLFLIISSAGFHKDYPIYEDYEHSKKILSGEIQDDMTFIMIFELDNPDKEKDNPAMWKKANPSLGVAVKEDGIIAEYQSSLYSEAEKLSFYVKNLNVWTDGRASTWIPTKHWQANKESFEIEELLGRKCYGGLDLSKNIDWSVFTLYFPPVKPDEKIKVIHKIYIPENTIEEKEKTDAFQIRKWIKQGYITATAGNAVNHDYIFEDILDAFRKYDVVEIGVDKNLSGHIEAKLKEKNLDDYLIEIPQNIMNFSPISKDWELAIYNNSFQDPNPCMEYCLRNTVVRPDINNNIKPDKADKNKRIDMVITSIQAYSRLLANETSINKSSVYDSLIELEREKENINAEKKSTPEPTIYSEESVIEKPKRKGSLYDCLLTM